MAAFLLPQVETPGEVASATKSSPVQSAAPDPRSTFVLSSVAADAILSLAQTKHAFPESGGFESRSALSIRFEGGESASGPAIVQGRHSDDEAVDPTISITLLSTDEADAATPLDLRPLYERNQDFLKSVGASAAKDEPLVMARPGCDWINAIGVYLMCNNMHYEDFKNKNPNLNVYWVNVDDKKIMVFWPKTTLEKQFLL
ncbi:hypothetical protein [Methylobacterium sp. NEAU K]|uniref:hypothetical protein n=1 Tax=Methylobacterium sp. NEAU K TaxID=3064946 RepID=UPI00273293AF|nr:hypothetical protein [Methylobacterium sp. NEAU K]MDP4004717.1 hypothetical protein [Methylobacterium sp. NEAU K]